MPVGVAGQRILIPEPKVVRFDVGLIDHVKPVLVCQLVPLGPHRVVAVADGVDVVLLHEPEVLHHRLAGDVVAHLGVVPVPIYTPKEHRLAVGEHPVVRLLNLAEANVRPPHFYDLPVPVPQRQEQRAERRRLGGPLVRILNGPRQDERRRVGHRLRFAREGAHAVGAVGREELGLNGVCALDSPEMGEVHVHLKLSVLVLGVEVGTHEEVADVLRPGRPQKPVAVEPREAPHVLVLQAAAVAEAVNLRGHDVVPHLQVLGHLEDSQGARALAVAHLLAIDPEKERRVGPFELEKHAAVVPAVGNGKGAAVGPDGITRVMGREPSRAAFPSRAAGSP